MSVPTAAPVRTAEALRRFEAIDAAFVRWAREWGAEESQFPALIDAQTLARAEYPSAFPHLVMTACRCVDPAVPLERLFAQDNLADSGWRLSPAVCYHVYPLWEGLALPGPRVTTARGRCFRSEASFAPGRRQVDFEMRELVLCGPASWIEARAKEATERIGAIGSSWGISGRWDLANDPFFLPTAKGKAMMQRIQETKREFLVGEGSGLAIASINLHGAFFAERFKVASASGEPFHTACIAFGLDRWATCANAS